MTIAIKVRGIQAASYVESPPTKHHSFYGGDPSASDKHVASTEISPARAPDLTVLAVATVAGILRYILAALHAFRLLNDADPLVIPPPFPITANQIKTYLINVCRAGNASCSLQVRMSYPCHP